MNFVRSIQAGSVVVDIESGIDVERLRALGGRRKLLNRHQWVIGTEGDVELAGLLAALRDLGVAFAGGQGWPPSAQFERLRDAGLIDGPYLEVVWRGPEQPQTVRHE